MLNYLDRFKKYPFDYLLLFFSGVSLTFSFAPFNFSFLAWISFVPFLYFLRNGKNPFFKGFVMGFGFFSTLLYWVPFSNVVEGTIVPLVVLGSFVLVLYLSLFFGFSGSLYNKLNRLGYPFLFPIVFAGLEFLRSLSSVWGFTWGSIGFSQSNLIRLVQFASIGGLPLVTLWVLFLNLFLYLFIIHFKSKTKEKMIYLCFFVTLLIIPFIYSQVIINRKYHVKYKTVCVVQPCVLPNDKRKTDFDRLLKIKKIIEDSPDADLYVLPETASPFSLTNSYETELFFRELASEKAAPIIIGTIDYKREGSNFVYYNAVSIVDSSGIKGIYRKIFLVPFVERLPFDDVLPKLKDINLGQGSFTPGADFTVFDIDSLKFSIYVCYEAIFPQILREFVEGGAELLVNITEDGWFGKTSGPYQHAQMAVFQSIIFRRAVVRSANTGISLACDPYGRVLDKTQIFKEGLIICKVPLVKSKTLYSKIGNTFGWSFLFFVLLLVIYRKK